MTKAKAKTTKPKTKKAAVKKSATKAAPKKIIIKKAPTVAVETKEPKIVKGRNYIENPTFNTDARDGEKSGELTVRLLETNALTSEEIVEAVKNNFPSSKVGPAHVAFYRHRLRKAGTKLLNVKLDKDGKRYTA